MIKAIIFSNSTKSLDVFLQSIKTHHINIFEPSVLYSGEDVDYIPVLEKYNIKSFKKESNFKNNLLELMDQTDSGFIAFFKDTNYFFNALPDFDIEQIMVDEDVFCFSFALGKNITHCYHNDVYNVLLNDEENSPNTIKWNWVKHYLDFGRPLELGAGHTFHKKEIIKLFKKWNYNSIQTLESSFDNLDYYPKELMSSFKHNVLVDIVLKTDNVIEGLKRFEFNKLDRTIIEI